MAKANMCVLASSSLYWNDLKFLPYFLLLLALPSYVDKIHSIIYDDIYREISGNNVEEGAEIMQGLQDGEGRYEMLASDLDMVVANTNSKQLSLPACHLHKMSKVKNPSWSRDGLLKTPP